jgi:hypothetical protein
MRLRGLQGLKAFAELRGYRLEQRAGVQPWALVREGEPPRPFRSLIALQGFLEAEDALPERRTAY